MSRTLHIRLDSHLFIVVLCSQNTDIYVSHITWVDDGHTVGKFGPEEIQDNIPGMLIKKLYQEIQTHV